MQGASVGLRLFRRWSVVGGGPQEEGGKASTVSLLGGGRA